MSQDKPTHPLPPIPGQRLFASSPDRQIAERRKIDELTQYRRNYWQRYKEKIRRVFGRLTIAEYDFWKARADRHQRSVWLEIYLCACAYVKGIRLPTRDILEEQQLLHTDLLRIGNNINQAVRLGHIKANNEGRLYAEPDDHIGQMILQGMQDLERRICRFEVRMDALHPQAHSAPSQ